MKVNKDSISYCLSTVSHPQSSAQPESRFCVHRGFVNERRKSDDVSPNPDKPEQIGTALLVCTDIRSPKIDQLLDRKLDTQVGQPASICWWFAATGEQVGVYQINLRFNQLTYLCFMPLVIFSHPHPQTCPVSYSNQGLCGASAMPSRSITPI